ncbi:RNA polymerase sigma factor [Acrocarpospora catenulata]|uniref:RNA polymerase sigma factor n=1 Tax=Acrocarpospora catenulata TaxID=2836182 RepID=UPI001BD96C17|nr:RNA polymerase sigma factor [Acrocarpospora catenulata]
MPGWPNVGRADENRLLEALRQGDAHAPASLYDAYADRLTDYAYGQLRDLDAAADAVHDAMVTAQASANRLSEPGRLRAWLYALTRYQCVARAAGRTATGLTGPQPGLEDAEDPELAAVVVDALGELSRPEREVLELSVRHGLSGGEVSVVLGLTTRQVGARLNRARDHLENAGAAVVLARVGRAHCPAVSAMLDSYEGPVGVALRRRLSKHISGCEVCVEGKQRHVSAGRLLDLVPIMFPPLSLRRRVVDTCVNPDRGETRVLIAGRSEKFDGEGFPVTAAFPAQEKRGRRAAPRRSRRALPVVAALACAVAAAGTLAWAAGSEEPGKIKIEAMRPPSTQPLLNPTDGPLQDPAEETPEEPDTVAETPESDPEPTARPQLSARPTSTVSQPRPTATKTRAPRPGAPALSLSCPGDMGDTGGDVIWVSARNAAINWTATVTGGVSVSSTKGRLKAGATGRVTVNVEDPKSSGSATIAFRSAGGNPVCRVSWRGEDPGSPPNGVPEPTPPVRTPTPTPPASPSPPDSNAPGQGGEAANPS